MTRPNPHIALIYHYDLARALAGEVVDWQAIPVNVDAGREGGDLCRAAADFAKRRDLFAMPAPSTVVIPADAVDGNGEEHPHAGCTIDVETGECLESAVPAAPTVVEQQAADPEPSTASTAAPGPAVNDELRVAMAWDRACLIARIKDLVDQGHETLIRQWWPEGVPTLKHDGHTDAQLQLILAAVRRVEAEVGSGWHPDDGPPPHVNTDPRASIQYPVTAIDEGGMADDDELWSLTKAHWALTADGAELCRQIAKEASTAGRSISLSQNPTVRRWSIARAVIAWAASGRTVDELWLTASTLATFEQCRDPSATLGGLISQFTIEQAERLYQAAGQ